MPEGPELHLASRFVNLACKGRIFGKICKSEVSKHADIAWDHVENGYSITAVSRGKEVKLTLTALDHIKQPDDKAAQPKHSMPNKTLGIVFQFGMSGKFDFYAADELKKHAHLNFFTRDEPKMVLSFVDYRRFGKWTQGIDWSIDRGPCVLQEYTEFRKNVLENLDKTAFSKPICEVLLNQKYFNGIGNYLRAEILYRAGIPPFTCARTVLEPLLTRGNGDAMVKSEKPDVLELCNILPQEVVNLEGTGYDPEDRNSYSTFSEWLQCYYQEGMKNLADHNKRTMWFSGSPGPMVPKDGVSRGMKRSSKSRKNKKISEAVKEENTDEPKPRKRSRAGRKSDRKNIQNIDQTLMQTTETSSVSDIKLSPAEGTTRLTRDRVKRISKKSHKEETDLSPSPLPPKRRKESGKQKKGSNSGSVSGEVGQELIDLDDDNSFIKLTVKNRKTKSKAGKSQHKNNEETEKKVELKQSNGSRAHGDLTELAHSVTHSRGKLKTPKKETKRTRRKSLKKS